ncbi:ABC transporter permease [Plantactinospora sp. S1510]|uniref:ABC transporter permease n=1 Tax=Plantactinospora alkalitolerans TaxID=2789879 RepID=A0ABS0H019_9ACTN|nr:ABC transporter permease [Plantactinospora alkalitolerans]MBF9131684.1 ABC transporter permease [Plantactinospora alkalitolerans]
MTALLGAELLRLRTTRGVWLLLAVAQLLIVVGVSGVMRSRDDVGSPEVQQAAIAHVGLISLFTLVLGIMAMAGEYRHRTITDTYLTVPRRTPVVVAKLVVHTVAGLLFGAVTALVAVAAAAIWLTGRGSSLDVGSTDLWLTVAGGVAWNAAFAAIGVGVGALITNQIGAIAASLAWLALVEGLVARLVGDAQHWLPFALGSALNRLPTATDGPPQWQAGLALAGYAVAFVVAGVATTVRRDIT